MSRFYIQYTIIDADNEESPAWPEVMLLEFDDNIIEVTQKLNELERLAKFIYNMDKE